MVQLELLRFSTASLILLPEEQRCVRVLPQHLFLLLLLLLLLLLYIDMNQRHKDRNDRMSASFVRIATD